MLVAIITEIMLKSIIKDRNLLIFQNDWGISWALEHNKGLILSAVGKSEE